MADTPEPNVATTSNASTTQPAVVTTSAPPTVASASGVSVVSTVSAGGSRLSVVQPNGKTESQISEVCIDSDGFMALNEDLYLLLHLRLNEGPLLLGKRPCYTIVINKVSVGGVFYSRILNCNEFSHFSALCVLSSC